VTQVGSRRLGLGHDFTFFFKKKNCRQVNLTKNFKLKLKYTKLRGFKVWGDDYKRRVNFKQKKKKKKNPNSHNDWGLGCVWEKISAILNQIAMNCLGTAFLKNCDLKTQKICVFKSQLRRCFFENT
jgi:hypothetical protein